MQKLSFFEVIFIITISSVLGIVWWVYSFAYDVISPLLKTTGLDGLLEGFWHIGGTLLGYIIRKPGAAILGETIAASVEGVISQWGYTAIVSGLVQGAGCELAFAATAYRKYNYFVLILASILSAVFSYGINWYLYGIKDMSTIFQIIRLSSSTLSAILLAGILGKIIGDRLAKTGILNQFKIAHAQNI